MTADSDPSPGPRSAPARTRETEPRTRQGTIASIGEFALIRLIRAMAEGPSGRTRTPDASSDLLLGIGDDAALVRPEPGWDLALTCDVQVCGRHFDPRWMGAETIGRRAMTANLSDIAAMGGEPRYALVSLGLPGSLEVAVVEELYRGFLEAIDGTKARIIGGNITSCGPEWFVDITLVGRIESGQALTRGGARPGDRILVTGSPGRSAAGLAVLRSAAGSEAASSQQRIEQFLIANPWARSLVRAFRQPEARIAAGRLLATAADRPVTALVDISDGLIGGLAHVCDRSGVRARIEADRFPYDLDLEAAAAYFGGARTAWTTGPGDDYELLLTVRPTASDRVAKELRAATGLMVTEIGEILPPAVPSSGGVAQQRTVPAPEGVPPRKVLPRSAGGPPPQELGIDRCLVEVTGLPPGEPPPGGWDHFRAKL